MWRCPLWGLEVVTDYWGVTVGCEHIQIISFTLACTHRGENVVITPQGYVAAVHLRRAALTLRSLKLSTRNQLKVDIMTACDRYQRYYYEAVTQLKLCLNVLTHGCKWKEEDKKNLTELWDSDKITFRSVCCFHAASLASPQESARVKETCCEI